MTSFEIEIVKGLAAAPAVNPFYAEHGSKAVAREIDTFFIAKSVDGKVLGVVRFCVENDVPMLRSMRVHTDFHRQKIGLKILETFEAYLNRNGVRETYCVPYAHLEDFYARIGFKKADESSAPRFLQERIVEYRKAKMDVICMVRESRE